MTKQRKVAYLALLGNTVLWGIALPIVKKGFDAGLTPMAFLFWRYVIAVIASLPIAIFILSRNKPSRIIFKPINLIKIIGLELIGTVLSLILLYEGLAKTGAIEGTLIAITYPIIVTIGGIWFFKERQEKHEWLGLAIAIFGTILLILNPLLKSGITGSLTGNLLIFIQNVTIAAYYLLAKYNYKNLDKWLVAHISFWIGLIGFGLIMYFSGGWQIENFKFQISNLGFWPLAATAYMGTAGSILALVLYLIGQDKIEASEAAIFTYLQPIFTIPFSIWLLKESVSTVEIIALMIILFGVWYNSKHEKRRSPNLLS